LKDVRETFDWDFEDIFAAGIERAKRRFSLKEMQRCPPLRTRFRK
jgi:hypothetical protein